MENTQVFNGCRVLSWLPDTNNISEKSTDSPILSIMAFHYFDRYYKELGKWLEILEKLAQEYAGRIQFGAFDVSTISTCHNSLSPDNFGSYRANVPPRVFGKDAKGFLYTMHMLFNYKYLKDFCDKLIDGKMYQAVVINPIEELDSAPRNYYELKEESVKDFYIMWYDPGGYLWPIQLRRLRKLSKLLANENIDVIIINKGNNYLAVDVDNCSEANCFQSATAYAGKHPVAWRLNIQETHYCTTRGHLRHIAKSRIPELIEYDSEGHYKYPELCLEEVRYLYGCDE